MSEPPLSPYTPPTTQHIHHHYYPQKEISTAVLLEVIPGLFGIFGIGHMYLGRVGLGFLFLFGFWIISGINFVLSFVAIGLITGPLCYVATLIISPIIAVNYCKALIATNNTTATNNALPPAA